MGLPLLAALYFRRPVRFLLHVGSLASKESRVGREPSAPEDWRLQQCLDRTDPGMPLAPAYDPSL